MKVFKMQTPIKIFSETTLFVKAVVAKPKCSYFKLLFSLNAQVLMLKDILFFNVNLIMLLHQPVTLNMLLIGDSNISYSENLALFNFRTI